MKDRIPTLGLASLVSFACLMGCTRPTQLRVPLDYRPTDRATVTGFNVPSGLRLAVTVEDARGGTAEIGKNSENAPAVPVYPADPAIDAFVRDAVIRELANLGITAETAHARGTKMLDLRIRRFWVEETSTYKGEITADVHLADAAGRYLWQGQMTGTSERFGRSLNVENYQETLSDSVVDLVQKLFQNSAFVEALEASTAQAQQRKGHK